MSENFWNDPDVSGQVDALAADALEHWRDEAIKAHPGAASLREYLTAGSKQATIDLAKDLEAKIGPTQPAPSSPAVTGGSPALAANPGEGDDSLSEAREALRRNPNSNAAQTEYLRAKFEASGQQYPPDVYND